MKTQVGGPPYTVKDKGFTRASQLPTDTEFIVPNKNVSFEKFLKVMVEEPNLAIIKREIYPSQPQREGKGGAPPQGVGEG